jgi:WD40 repeat protein
LTAASFNSDATRLAATSRRGAGQGWEGDLKVWDVATGKRIVDISAHSWWDADIAFHPSEPYVAITGKQHTVQFYDAVTGQLLSSIPTNGYLCSTMAFTPDGTRLFANLAGAPKLIDARPDSQPFAKSKIEEVGNTDPH